MNSSNAAAPAPKGLLNGIANFFAGNKNKNTGNGSTPAVTGTAPLIGGKRRKSRKTRKTRKGRKGRKGTRRH